MVKWVSGLNQFFAKESSVNSLREFESVLYRQSLIYELLTS